LYASFILYSFLFSKEIGRVLKGLLVNRSFDINLFGPVAELFPKLYPDVRDRIDALLEVVSEIREPLVVPVPEARVPEKPRVPTAPPDLTKEVEVTFNAPALLAEHINSFILLFRLGVPKTTGTPSPPCINVKLNEKLVKCNIKT
jgi:hypothetical protein